MQRFIRYFIATLWLIVFGCLVWALYEIPLTYAFLLIHRATIAVPLGVGIGLMLSIAAFRIKSKVLSVITAAIPFIVMFFNFINERQTGIYLFAAAILYGMMCVYVVTRTIKEKQRP